MSDHTEKDPALGHVPPTTAAITPALFAEQFFFARSRKAVLVIIAVFVALGFGLRVASLGTESLGEDELNKLQTVEEYRANGLSGKNGEHPFLMKGLQTVSVSAAEKLNSAAGTQFAPEFALRLPVAVLGTLSIILLFLFVSELFGRTIGLIAAGLWAVEPMAVGFDRIAKEDSLVLCFFLLTNFLWVRGQTRAETGKSWLKYAWGTAAAFAALMASKYYPHLLAITGAYYNCFANLPHKKWGLGKQKWLVFMAIMGVSFIILNPTIVLPETWREMVKFSTENRIGHDSYEFMGSLYVNKATAWLSGVPWTFFYVFIAVKTSLTTLVLFLCGIPFFFKRKMGDGRLFIFFWAFMWFLPFTFLGGKFVRYFTLPAPLLLISAAVAIYFGLNWLSRKFDLSDSTARSIQAAVVAIAIAVPLSNSLAMAPHYRLFTNTVGGGAAAAGSYFPHDEFYDAATNEIVVSIASASSAAVTVANETPGLFEYYAKRNGRADLKMVSLSDREAVAQLKEGDVVAVVKGRRYFSNTPYLQKLAASGLKPKIVSLNGIPAAEIYTLDAATAAALRSL